MRASPFFGHDQVVSWSPLFTIMWTEYVLRTKVMMRHAHPNQTKKSHKGTRVSVHCLHKSFTSFLRFKVRSAKYSTQTPPTPAFTKQSTIHGHQKKRRSSSEVHAPNNPTHKKKTPLQKAEQLVLLNDQPVPWFSCTCFAWNNPYQKHHRRKNL